MSLSFFFLIIITIYNNVHRTKMSRYIAANEEDSLPLSSIEEKEEMSKESKWNVSFTVDMYDDNLSQCTQTGCYNVLFLTGRSHLIDFMDRFLDFRYNATKRHPNSGTVVLWVVDRMWFGYNTKLTIAENIKEKFGDIGFFHIVHVESTGGGEKVNEQIREITKLSATTAVTIHHHESHDQSGVRHQFNSINASIVYFAYANDAIHYSADDAYRRIIAHAPHCADTKSFSASVTGPRSVDVLLAGSSWEHYPIRRRFHNLLHSNKSKLIKGTTFEKIHPGWFSNQKFTSKDTETWKEARPFFLSRITQVDEYSRMLKNAKIVVTDSSTMGYALQKFSEIAMAGSLIIGALPHERLSFFKKFAISINYNDSDDHIIETINYWLRHHKERIKKCQLGQKLTDAYFSWDVQITHMFEYYDMWKNGEFGAYFPYDFKIACASKNTSIYALNPYCGGHFPAWYKSR